MGSGTKHSLGQLLPTALPSEKARREGTGCGDGSAPCLLPPGRARARPPPSSPRQAAHPHRRLKPESAESAREDTAWPGPGAGTGLPLCRGGRWPAPAPSPLPIGKPGWPVLSWRPTGTPPAQERRGPTCQHLGRRGGRAGLQARGRRTSACTKTWADRGSAAGEPVPVPTSALRIS